MTLTLTRDQIRRVDELAVSRYGMTGLVLMENAGRNAARAIKRAYGPAGSAFICCGPGNNGGDGCVIARHLHNIGWSVRVAVTGEESKMSPDMLANFGIVKAMGLEPKIAVTTGEQGAAVASIEEDTIVIDALLGTGFAGEVRSPLAELILSLNKVPKEAVVAVDVPSGLDCQTGRASSAVVRADLTITFVARKTGFDAPEAAPYLGRVEVVDIGAPRELIEEIAAG
jgi:NAD(P)H-hydrate epimerase